MLSPESKQFCWGDKGKMTQPGPVTVMGWEKSHVSIELSWNCNAAIQTNKQWSFCLFFCSEGHWFPFLEDKVVREPVFSKTWWILRKPQVKHHFSSQQNVDPEQGQSACRDKESCLDRKSKKQCYYSLQMQNSKKPAGSHCKKSFVNLFCSASRSQKAIGNETGRSRSTHLIVPWKLRGTEELWVDSKPLGITANLIH